LGWGGRKGVQSWGSLAWSSSLVPSTPLLLHQFCFSVRLDNIIYFDLCS
jgi:hypothetical protein